MRVMLPQLITLDGSLLLLFGPDSNGGVLKPSVGFYGQIIIKIPLNDRRNNS